MSDTIFLCLRNSKIANFLGSVSFFEPTPKVLEKCRKTGKQQRKWLKQKFKLNFCRWKENALEFAAEKERTKYL